MCKGPGKVEDTVRKETHKKVREVDSWSTGTVTFQGLRSHRRVCLCPTSHRKPLRCLSEPRVCAHVCVYTCVKETGPMRNLAAGTGPLGAGVVESERMRQTLVNKEAPSGHSALSTRRPILAPHSLLSGQDWRRHS